MKKIELSAEIQIVLRKAAYEFTRAKSNYAFMVSKAIERNDVDFIDSAFAKDLDMKLREAVANRDLIFNSIVIVAAKIDPVYCTYRFQDDFMTLEYEEGATCGSL